METIIDKEPQSGEMLIDNTINKTSTTISTTISNNIINTKDALKEELKKIPISERHQLLNSILLEERNEYIKKQKEEEKKQEEEKKCSNCPLSKKIKIMNFEIQDLKIELQKSKNEMNDMKQTMKNNMKKECQLNTYTKKNKCPYSLFSLGSLGCSLGSLDINTSTNKYPYNNDEENLDKFCEELTETYTSSFSWWFTIMFIVFMLFILTSKPIKPLKSINLCDSLFF